MNALWDDTPFAESGTFAGRHLHLGVSGSVACYKAVELLRAWRRLDMEVSATLTAGAQEFVRPLLFASLGASPVYGGMFEPGQDVFAHLEPGRSADAMIVAPASAGLLSRLATGAASDMLSAQALAFAGPLLVAPAMNPRMWAHAATQENVARLRARGVTVVGPDTGAAACGDQGQGRLAGLSAIFLAALRALAPQDMAALRVLVTLGPTREPWDGVRYWSNPSSGRMGAALAACAWLRGATVTCL
ncbi:MAG: bifunctional phosphopantothenoylcysteine decarboxylase/phosphopantothenate--cysteine ligase CoaBC, partial [Desulfovibrio sp.]|nr:bifunctional phosphopantothenoylcysteine decarboxylase/phosphopantothenate--cysteine ligase CoaBC [Desulfovibrio sp.]